VVHPVLRAVSPGAPNCSGANGRQPKISMLPVSQQVGLFEARFLPLRVGGVMVSPELSSADGNGLDCTSDRDPPHGCAGGAGIIASLCANAQQHVHHYEN
jgi:hypothetical protein